MSHPALQEAGRFLRPVLSREDFARAKTASIVDKIFEEYPAGLSATETKADAVVIKATLFLERIQLDLLKDKEGARTVLETPALRRTVDALLDLVSLEGIYPRLLPGVGVPIERRVQSVLQGGVSITEVENQSEDGEKLSHLMDRLYLVLTSNQGIAPAMQQRILVDILAALLQLAYSSSSRHQEAWATKANSLINSLSPTILFPSLISLLHSTTPSWLKPHVTIPLSLLPMRADGVRQTITFVAKSTPQRPAQNIESASSVGIGPALPLEILSQVSKVLSSVPSTITAEKYFDSVAPQLYALLEDQDRDAQRAAIYTISHGILSKRVLGAPGAVGWQYFAEPLLVAINPDLEGISQEEMPLLERGRALSLLTTILSEFPNPAVSKRVLGSIVLPLWQISCLQDAESTESKTALDLLKLYFHTVVGTKGLTLIADNLMSGTGTRHATNNQLVQDVSFGEDELNTSLPTVRSMRSSETISHLNVDEMIRRSMIFTELVKACPVDEAMGELFASILKVSICGFSTMRRLKNSSADSINYLSYSHISQALIREVGPQIMGDISTGLFVINEVLSSQIFDLQSPIPGSATVTRSSLETVVRDDKEEDKADIVSNLETTLGICLPWLAVVLQQQSSSDIEKARERIASVQSLLETFLYSIIISRTTKKALRSTITLLSKAGSNSAVSGRTTSTTFDQELQLHASALENLQASEIPIRVQGLSELEQLVAQGSSLVSVSSAVLTVLALLQDQDSFVYLSAVKTLVKLAKEDPQSTIKSLQEAYQDITEQSSIDVRLRIGEAIQTIAEEIGQSLPAPTIIHLIELLLHMSSRRALRTKNNLEPNRPEVSSSIIYQEDNDDDLDPETSEMKAEKDAEMVLKSWQGKLGVEDLRLRTSALTVLGTIFEHVLFSVTVSLLKPTLELIVRILKEEKGQENAIIRRAAVLTVLCMVKGADGGQSDAASTAASAYTEDIVLLHNVDTIFIIIASEDEDEIVRGHAEVLVKSIQEWREESFTRLLRGDTIKLELTDHDGNMRLKGIDVDLNTATIQREQKKQRIQELD